MKSTPHLNPLSELIEIWLNGDADKTISGAVSSFGDKVLPILIIMLMSLPALPIPTGGISHVMEVISILLSVQMFFGIDRLLFPKSWQHRRLPASFEKKGFGLLIKQLKRVEAHSRMRGEWVTKRAFVKKLTAGLSLIGIVAAMFAPPFSGLDTFPAFGVVILMLGYIMSDAIFWLIGSVIILIGIILELTIGALLLTAMTNLIESNPYISIALIVTLGILLLLKAKRFKGTLS